MDKKKFTEGQTLVELAIVLPCFCLGVFMAVQLITYCHNMVELERMAQVTVDRVSYENIGAPKPLTRFNSLWGHFILSLPQSLPAIPRPWRAFHGISTIQTPGRLFSVQVGLDLLPGDGFSRVLSTVSERALAENYLEPPIPPEE